MSILTLTECDLDSPWCDCNRPWYIRLFKPTKFEKVTPMTLYGDEPRHYVACKPCAEAYVEEWNERWNEYHREIMAGLSLADTQFPW